MKTTKPQCFGNGVALLVKRTTVLEALTPLSTSTLRTKCPRINAGGIKTEVRSYMWDT